MLSCKLLLQVGTWFASLAVLGVCLPDIHGCWHNGLSYDTCCRQSSLACWDADRTPEKCCRQLRFHPVANPAPRHLTQDQISQYNSEGYILPVDIFTPSEAAASRAYFQHLLKLAELAGHDHNTIDGWHTVCSGIWNISTHPRILDLVEDLLDPNLVCSMTHYFAKLPGDRRVSWHQDASYWPLTPSETVTVWLAIDDVGIDNAPMHFIPGSHLQGEIPWRPSSKRERNMLYRTVLGPRRWGWGGPHVNVMLQAGQASLHTDMLLHSSDENLSKRRRCGLTLRYHSPDVRLVPSEGRTAWPRNGRGIIARGSDPTGFWRHIPRPRGARAPRAGERSLIFDQNDLDEFAFTPK